MKLWQQKWHGIYTDMPPNSIAPEFWHDHAQHLCFPDTVRHSVIVPQDDAGKMHYFMIATVCKQHWTPSHWWDFATADWDTFCRYFFDFPWNDFCFRGRGPSESAYRITEGVLSGFETLISSHFSKSNTKNFWSTHACSSAVHKKEEAYKRYKCLRIQKARTLYVSLTNHTKSVSRLTRNSLTYNKCYTLSNSSSSCSSWCLT